MRAASLMMLLVTVLAVLFVQENDINPFNGKPYSQKYKDIMKKRKDLPVFQQMGESPAVSVPLSHESIKVHPRKADSQGSLRRSRTQTSSSRSSRTTRSLSWSERQGPERLPSAFNLCGAALTD